MKTINRDILTIDHGVIVQQVNCQGVMGAGLAKQIADKWPVVKEYYLSEIRNRTVLPGHQVDGSLLGATVVSRVKETLWVGSIFGQDRYGRGVCHTRYWALSNGLYFLRWKAKSLDLPIYIPHGIGCGLAGGDWGIVSALIEQELPDAVICKLS